MVVKVRGIDPMETTPNQSSSDGKNDPTREKMEKRLKNLFTEQEPPSYASNREVDALKQRIADLEAVLTQKAEDVEQNVEQVPTPFVAVVPEPDGQLHHKASAVPVQLDKAPKGLRAMFAGMLDRWSYPRKFAIISLLFLLPLMTFYPLVNEQVQRIGNYGYQESRGVDYLSALNHVLNDVQLYQIASARYYAGEIPLTDLQTSESKVDVSLMELAQVHSKVGALLGLSNEASQLTTEWKGIKGNYTDSQAVLSLQARLVTDIQALIFKVGNNSYLILDPDLDTYYTMDAVLLKIPENQVLLSQILELTGNVARSKTFTSEQKAQLNSLMGRYRSNLDAMNTNIATALQNNRSGQMKPIIGSSLSAYTNLAGDYLTKLEQQFITSSTLNVNTNALITDGQKLMAVQEVLYDSVSSALQVGIRGRINSLTIRLVLGLGFALITTIIAFIIGLTTMRAISRPLQSIASAAERVVSGDLTARAAVLSRDEVGQTALAFNIMTNHLNDALNTLADRTHDLMLAAEVGQNISRVDEIDALLINAVALIRQRFDLYYVQIYLLDSTGSNLVLRAGTGEVGQELLRRGFRLPLNVVSLNGTAVVKKRAVIVSDAAQTVDFRPNPLLPNTRSEMCIPLLTTEGVVGVLDLQSERSGTFSDESLPVFNTLAAQIAVTIQNSVLFQQVQQDRLLIEEQSRRFTRSGWREFLNAVERSETIGYDFDQNEVRPLTELDFVADGASMNIPIEVSGAQIGEVQLTDDATRKWTAEETEIIQTVTSRVAQHIETMRLLAQAESYRYEAEQVSRRLTSEGWSEYFRTRKEIADGFHYNQDKVQPLNGNGHHIASEATITHPLTIRDEPIGMMMVTPENASDTHATELLAAVAEQLSDHIENLRLLEQAEQRRLELETVATVSSTVSTVLDPDKLLRVVVNMTKERFALYHVHIYLAEDERDTLLLAAGAGDIGKKMVAQKHAISMDAEHSLVARASRERNTIIANDVKSAPDFLPNSLLPDTRAEMAIPMIVGTDVLGVFDVQSDKSGGFSKEDSAIYTTLASQVAVALQNARLYVKQAATVTQLRELDRLKSAFLANMSHELRTPLNSILGFTDVMLEGLDGDLTDYMDNDLRLIQKNGRHLLHLINDVLDMAKIESGRMNLHPETFKLNDLLEEVTSITAPLASEKNLSLFIDPGSDADIQIYADNTRLRQVMINLVNNSIKFTERGKISLFVKPIDGARVLIAVKDTGIGIPQDHLEAVFQEFTQVDTSTTRKAGGTGLGLPISRRLIEMHGGRLWAESTGVSGEGSTFFVEMPLEARIADIEKQEK
jgi:signal transduction histidine kinase/HAMP domain-containing protein